MVLLINQRCCDVAGHVQSPELLESAAGATPTYRLVSPDRMAEAVRGRHVVTAIHGFAVTRPQAVRAYATLEAALDLPADHVFFGVLWPGDSWLPVVSYPAETQVASRCGADLAAFLNRNLAGAASLNLISHSLGGRVLLECVSRLSRPVREVCVTAGAVDSDALHARFAEVKAKVGRLSILSSREDQVLRLAYPCGDFGAALLFHDHDRPWRGALGLGGPKPAEARPKVVHRQIPSQARYGHGDYFPPVDGGLSGTRWPLAVAYMRRAVAGAPDAWPDAWPDA